MRQNISLVILLFVDDCFLTDWCNFCFFFQVSANGNVLRSEIVGSIKMRVFLSGMPELRLGLNDKVLFENTGSESVIKQNKIIYCQYLIFHLLCCVVTLCVHMFL